MYRLSVIGFPLVVLLAACDFSGGLLRYAEFEGTLTPPCVRQGLERVEGVSSVRYRQPTSSGDYHRFDYEVAGLANHLQFESRRDRKVRYWNEYALLNGAPPQAEVDRIRPYLRAIDQSIGLTCGIDDLPSQVSEVCRNVECN